MTLLSPEQFVIWKHLFDKHRRAALNIPITIRLFGLVDNDALVAAVRDVIERHEILRTIFPESDDVPRQEILNVDAVPELAIRQTDTWSISKVLKAEISREFDLTRETPMRAHLFSIGQGEHTLLFVFHRIAFDSRSVDPFIRDLFACYSARVENREPDLPPLPMQYADYARTRDSINKPELRVCNSRTEDNAAVDDKATDDEDFESNGIIPIRINPGLHGLLLAFAKETDVSVEAVLRAGFTVLTARFFLGKEADFYEVDSARDRLPDSSVGNFETVMSFEIETRGNFVFREVVKHTAKTAYCRTVSIEKPADTASPSHNLRVLFRLKPVDIETLSFPMLKVFINPAPAKETEYELIFDLSERLSSDGKPQGLEGSVIFDRDVFTPQQMPMRIDRMMAMLKHGLLSPDVRIDEIPLEEEPEDWNHIALDPECPATAPKYVPMARVATVHDNGRSVRVPLNAIPDSSAMTTAPGWQQSYVAFQDALQCSLAGIWEETLNISRIGIRDRFVDLGGDEDKANCVVETINKVFRKTPPVSLICGGATIESVANAIFRELPFEPVSIIQPKRPDSKPPLFFVRGEVFGGGLYMVELSQYLGADRPLFSFNPHGLNGFDMPESIEKMAEDNLKILRQLCPDGSFWLGGFCNGALVAYEMARMMEREGQRLEYPLLLVEPPTGDISEMLSQSAVEQKSKRPSVAPSGLQMRKTWVLNELFRLSDRYRIWKYAGQVIAIQPEKSLSDASLVRSVWKKVVENIQFRTTPGDHITCIGRHAPELAGILREAMDAV